MPLIGYSSTAAGLTNEGITRRNLLSRFLRETGLGHYGTATGGSTTTIVDTTTLQSTQFSDQDWVGGWARISRDAGGAAAAPEAEISPITTYAPSTGTITVNPAFTAAPANTDNYELWRFPNPRIVLDILDTILQEEIWLPHWSPLSNIVDFDMEANNTTFWIASSATVTKSAVEPYINGKRCIKVVGANGRAETPVIYVEPSTTYYLSAIVQCTDVAATAAHLVAYDHTNSADIKTAIVDNIYFPNMLWFTFNTPATCKRIKVYLQVVGSATSETYWDDAVLFSLKDTSIPLPAWVKNKSQVKAIFSLEDNSLASDRSEFMIRGKIVTNNYYVQDSSFGRGQLKLHKKFGTINTPLFIFGTRNEETYANDNSDTKLTDETYLLAAVKYRVFDHLSQLPNAGSLDAGWINAKLETYRKEWDKYQYQQLERIEQIYSFSQQEQYYLNEMWTV